MTIVTDREEASIQQHPKAEVERSETSAPPKPRARRSSTEVIVRATRRRYTASYKLSILQEAEGCQEPGAIGALLRREGLYSSHLAKWRQQREEGMLEGLAAKRRGRKAMHSAERKEVERVRRELSRVQERLRQAEMIIEVQKKLSQVLGIELPSHHESSEILD